MNPEHHTSPRYVNLSGYFAHVRGIGRLSMVLLGIPSLNQAR